MNSSHPPLESDPFSNIVSCTLCRSTAHFHHHPLHHLVTAPLSDLTSFSRLYSLFSSRFLINFSRLVSVYHRLFFSSLSDDYGVSAFDFFIKVVISPNSAQILVLRVSDSETLMASIRLEASKPYYATSSLVIGYALCSSLLAVINKFAVTKFNYPGLLTALQYLTSALGVWILGKSGFLAHDPFVLETAKKFLPAAFVFYLAIFTNTNLLRHANVDTFIVFRSLTPLLVAIADTVFRRQACPSKLTFLSLVIILGAAVGYVATDNGFTLTAYSWALAYLVTITTEMVYIKHMVTNLGLNTWGFVFYNNLLSLMMAPVFWIVTGEYVDVFMAIGRSSAGDLFEPVAFFAVSLSCVFGLLISFFGFAARKAISATAFTVTGVVNKFLTVAINVLIWDKHATPIGLVCLLLTLAGGVLYQQSVAGNSSNQRESGLSKQIDKSNSAADGYSDEDDEKSISDKISGV